MTDRAPRCITTRYPPLRETLGAYALGALDPVEADQLSAHLAACAGCRAEYAELIELLPLLAGISESEAIGGPVRPESAVLGRVLADSRRVRAPGTDRPSRPRRSRRSRIVLAVACLVLAAGSSTAGVRMSSQHATVPNGWSASAEALRYPSGRPGPAITAAVQVAATNWGSKIELRMEHVQPGYVCSMVVVDLDGRREIGGTWSAPAGGSFTISGSASVAPGRIASIRVELPNGAPLVSLARPGGHLPGAWGTQ